MIIYSQLNIPWYTHPFYSLLLPSHAPLNHKMYLVPVMVLFNFKSSIKVSFGFIQKNQIHNQSSRSAIFLFKIFFPLSIAPFSPLIPLNLQYTSLQSCPCYSPSSKLPIMMIVIQYIRIQRMWMMMQRMVVHRMSGHRSARSQVHQRMVV